MFVYWEQRSHPTSVLTDTSPMSALPASTGYGSSDASDAHGTWDSATTLVHAFVSPRVDYCNILLAGVPKVVTDRLQRVMNAAARVLSSTHKYDRGLSRLLYLELHWLDVPERVQYKLGVVMYSCLHGQSPRYFADLCVPLSDVSARQHLRSATRRLLVVPR